MAYTTHATQLTDPRWQKKRLEILQRDNWKCQVCKNEKEQLEVHHIFYLPDWQLWEYSNDWLVTLCHKHHDQQKHHSKMFTNLFIILKTKGFLAQDLLALSIKIDIDEKFTKKLIKDLRKFQNT